MEAPTSRLAVPQGGNNQKQNPSLSVPRHSVCAATSIASQNVIPVQQAGLRNCTGSNTSLRMGTEDPTIGSKLAQLKQLFDQILDTENRGVFVEEFSDVMRSTIGANLDSRERQALFMKVDADGDGTVTWEEFVTFILLENQEKTLMIEMLREKPFPRELREIYGRHRDIIVRVGFYPTVGSMRKSSSSGSVQTPPVDYTNGRYVTLSKDGTVSFWGLNLKHQRSHTIDNSQERLTPLWMTDMSAMPSTNTIAVASTDRDISMYDISAMKFVKRCTIRGLEHCVLCMDYCEYVNEMDRAILVWGDASGSVYGLDIDHTQGGLFGGNRVKQKEYRRISWAELVRGAVAGVKTHRLLNLHDDWVCKVMYVSELQCFISCCQSERNSMYVGDFIGKKTCSYFKIPKGAVCFDYCPANSVIVTGGIDHCVRVWNPYVSGKAIVVLKGHNKPVIHIVINSKKGHIISMDKSKTVRIYNLKEQLVLQQISGRAIKMGPLPVTAIFFNPCLQYLILATNHLALLEKKEEEERYSDVISHNKPICAALYNSLFQLVVSACEDSIVSVWDINTGEKVIQFINAHKTVENGVVKPIEITAMCFDTTLRRLITAARDGSVRIWNFNNGACLGEFQTPDHKDVTAMVSSGHRLYVTGWQRQVGIFLNGAGNEEYKTWRTLHKDDILCMAFMPTNIMATGSYDGDIIIWSRETGQVYCRLNAFESVKPITESSFTEEKKKDEDELSLHETNSLSSKTSFLPLIRSNLSQMTEYAPVSSTGMEKISAQSIQHRFGMNLLSNVRKKNESREPKSTATKEKHSSIEHPLLPALYTSQSDKSCDVRTYTRQQYDKMCKQYEAAVDSMIFLVSRDIDKDTACLVTSGAGGWVRAWSIHHDGGLLGQFPGASKPSENVSSLTTDAENRYLITGDTIGYLKLWDITNYCTGKVMPGREEYLERMRKRFTFLRCPTREKHLADLRLVTQNNKNTPPPAASKPEKTIKLPYLLNSFRAHTRAINCVQYAGDRDLLITTSGDCSIRLWTLCGHYVGTFGQPWDRLQDTVDPSSFPRMIPGDLRRVASASTLKVLNGGARPRWTLALRIIQNRGLTRIKEQFQHMCPQKGPGWMEKTDETEAKLEKSNILGKSYKRKVRHRMPRPLPKLIEINATVGVYHTLPFMDLAPLEVNQMPVGLSEAEQRRLTASARVKDVYNANKVESGKKAQSGGFFNTFDALKSRVIPIDKKSSGNRLKQMSMAMKKKNDMDEAAANHNSRGKQRSLKSSSGDNVIIARQID